MRDICLRRVYYADVQEDTFKSVDGAQIAYHTLGAGPGLIVVPGALSVSANYFALAAELATRYTVHTIERRGRGRSGPMHEGYSIATECQDFESLRALTGASFVFGHSYGGLVALEVARRNPAVSKVAVYEPGVSIGGSIPLDWLGAYRRHLAAGRRLEAFAEFVRGFGPERAQRMPLWLMKAILLVVMGRDERRQRLALLETNLAEHEEVARLDGSYRNYAEVNSELLVMIGEKTEGTWVNVAAAGLLEVVPRSEVKRFAKLDHFGPDKGAPHVVGQALAVFFGAAAPAGRG